MNARHLISCLVALLVPLALGVLTFQAARAAPMGMSPAAVTASHMFGCPDMGAPQPAKAPACGPDCPLVCAPLGAGRSVLDVPLRPYARLHYDLAPQGLEGRALEPELPPPRRDRA